MKGDFINKKIFILTILNIFKEIIYGKKIKFLHIGKTGGSFIRDNLKLIDIDNKVKFLTHKESILENDGYQYIFFIRNPIDRFISAFWSRYRKGNPRYNFEWTIEEKITFEYFKTPNQLAEAIFSDDKYIKEKANKAIESIPHLRMNLSFHLKDKDNIKDCIGKILYIGRLETINNDLNNIIKILGYSKEDLKEIKNDNITTHKTPSEYSKLSNISKLGKMNLTKYFKNDYEIIKFINNNIIK